MHGTLRREALAVEMDTFQLMESVRSKVTLSALRTDDERYIFDDEEIWSFPYRFYNATYVRPVCPTQIADQTI